MQNVFNDSFMNEAMFVMDKKKNIINWFAHVVNKNTV